MVCPCKRMGFKSSWKCFGASTLKRTYVQVCDYVCDEHMFSFFGARGERWARWSCLFACNFASNLPVSATKTDHFTQTIHKFQSDKSPLKSDAKSRYDPLLHIQIMAHIIYIYMQKYTPPPTIFTSMFLLI